MRLVTWNVQTARPQPDGPPDVGRVVSHLRTLSADVVALQELDRGMARSGGADQARAVAEGLGGTLAWAPTLRRGGGEYGIALVVRGEVVRTWEVALGGRHEPRTLLVAEVDHGGRRWVVGATHLSRHRPVAARQLQRCLASLSTRPAPRVLAGDLNLDRRHVLPWSTAAGYHLVDGPPTHSTRRTRPTTRIDHVLVSGARVQRASVHGFDVSDHAAVAVTLA